MRSTLKTITFATIALSLAVGGAFAAGRHEPPSGRVSTHDHDSTDPQASSQYMPALLYKPRLNQVLIRLRSADEKIQQEEAMHRLSASAVRKLESETGSIHNQAMTAANSHAGAIPNTTYKRLKSDIRKLDQDIVRLS
ncbi:hypothetical protein GB927_025840 [Shinella sp. CPCC 100929]|uniref:Periplasmic heavy metal sensor n=1 Tax=Shinella lacus TaxID=2654216 RepID=A0ABT1RE62_9HYPH|nr:hypothetical protein [Shinella lacus]MCQ4633487.1 hypothetical protein [Shinella lacus]